MHTLVNQFLDLFFPPLCLSCQREGSWLCPKAQSELNEISVLIDPIHIDGVDRVICRGDYDQPPLGTIIQRVKYQYYTAPAATIYPQLLGSLIPYLRSSIHQSVITPIPLHWRRQMIRGFNQSQLLAHALENLTQQPSIQLIRRARHTAAQAKLNGQKRIVNVRGAFQVQSVAKIPNSVILVDDVITTGSTVRECASVLRQAGVKTIIAVALAKG